jgi:hypothetical protein
MTKSELIKVLEQVPDDTVINVFVPASRGGAWCVEINGLIEAPASNGSNWGFVLVPYKDTKGECEACE